MNIGFIYCLTNPSMPGLCKIGTTDRSPSQRCAELSAATACPSDFEIAFYAEVDNAFLNERRMHLDLDCYRHRSNREFFTCSPGLAFHWIQCNVDTYTSYVRESVYQDQARLLERGELVIGAVDSQEDQ